MNGRRAVPAWVLGILLVLSLVVAADAETALPSTPLSLLDGGTLNLRSLEGKVVVIRLLASW